MSQDDDFFIGWGETPEVDRRFLLKAGLGVVLGAGALGSGLAAWQRAPGPGTWNQGDVGQYSGVVTGAPYAMLRTNDFGEPKTALLSCLGKCGVAARIGALEGQAVRVTGSVIRRGPHVMIAVADGPDWIEETGAPAPPELAIPAYEELGDVELAGEILDSKCWFGAMRPGDGKVHKACASLCIRAGLPPAFFAKDGAGRGALLVMTEAGGAHGEAILPYVADPVRLRGRLRRRADMLFVDGPAASITRV